MCKLAMSRPSALPMSVAIGLCRHAQQDHMQVSGLSESISLLPYVVRLVGWLNHHDVCLLHKGCKNSM